MFEDPSKYLGLRLDMHFHLAPFHEGTKLSLFSFTALQQTSRELKALNNILITRCKNLMAACKLEFPTRHTIPETTEPSQAFMTQHARFLILCTHIEELPIFWHNNVPPLITCMLPFADLYLLQFCEKQVDIVHRIYLPYKGFCVFQKYLKWTRMLALLFWTLKTCTSSTRINSETLSESTGWRKC